MNSKQEVCEEEILQHLFDNYTITMEHQQSIGVYLEVLGKRDPATRLHSIRVAYLASRMGVAACRSDINPKVLVWAGLLHDIGKSLIDPSLFRQGAPFDEAAYKEMEQHVLFGVRLLRGVHDWTAYIIARHHRFGSRPYPEDLPPLPLYLKEKEEFINLYARLLALADFYDALMTRKDGKFGSKKLSTKEKRDIYLKENNDMKDFILQLERQGTLTFSD